MFLNADSTGIHNIRPLIEVFAILSQVFPTSLVILFCIISYIIINQYVNIGIQIEDKFHNSKAEFLNQLQSQYLSGEIIFCDDAVHCLRN